MATLNTIAKVLFVLALTAYGAHAAPRGGSVACMSPGGTPVDWYIALKVPQSIDGKGVAYNYADSESSGDFKYYTDINDDSESPLQRTVAQIATASVGELAQAFWNDETPDGSEHDSFAHAKGIVASDSYQGFIMVHSIPKYPTFTNGSDSRLIGTVPDPELEYGQHVFCVTVSIETINTYASGLGLDHVFTVSQSYIPSNLESDLPNLKAVLTNKAQNTSMNTMNIEFQSLGGQDFVKFAKNPKYDAPLYYVTVAPYYNTPMAFETWGDGDGGLMAPECSSAMPDVVSNLQIAFQNAEVTFSYTQDHSKYGISMGGSENYINCFGDLNRQDSQSTRGGGTVCFKDTDLHTTLTSFFEQQQKCSSSESFGRVPSESIVRELIAASAQRKL